jgi:hypothetical protein
MANKEKENQAETEDCNPHEQLTKSSSFRIGKSGFDNLNDVKEKIDDNASDARRGFFGKRRNNTAEARPPISQRPTKSNSFRMKDDTLQTSRPAFHSALYGQSSASTKVQPRAVAIPYSRFKKERFYDWPPDPTVSRATPITLFQVSDKADNDSLSASIPNLPISDHDDDEEDVLNSSLRRRRSSNVQRSSDIPDIIMF